MKLSRREEGLAEHKSNKRKFWMHQWVTLIGLHPTKAMSLIKTFLGLSEKIYPIDMKSNQCCFSKLRVDLICVRCTILITLSPPHMKKNMLLLLFLTLLFLTTSVSTAFLIFNNTHVDLKIYNNFLIILLTSFCIIFLGY